MKYLVFLENHRCNRKEIPVHHSSPWEHYEISTASLPGTWCTSTRHSGWNCQLHTNGYPEMQLGALHQLCIWPVPDRGFTPLQPSDQRIHAHSAHPNGLQHKFAQSLQIFVTANPFKFHRQHLLHTWHWPIKPSSHWTLKIISNYLQFRSSLLPPPQRHLLLQRKESDKDKLEKVMLCLATLYWANAEAIQTTCKFKVAEAREKIFELAENTWAIDSTGMINTNQACPAKNTNKPNWSNPAMQSWLTQGVTPRQWTTSSLLTNLKWQRSRWRPHGLGQRTDRTFQQGQHRGNPPSNTRPEDQVWWRVWHGQTIQEVRPNATSQGPLDLHLMILIALAVFQVGALIWRKCCWTQEQAMPIPSAPPMPMFIINPRPFNKAAVSNALIPISISIS